jgi:hypothetical protein
VSGGKLEEGHPREYVHTHMNVHENVKKGEEEMSRPNDISRSTSNTTLIVSSKKKFLILYV